MTDGRQAGGQQNGLLDKWRKRARLFRDAHNAKEVEVMALEIQKLDLLAHGADKVSQMQAESLRGKLVAVVRERNAARAQRDALLDILHDAEETVLTVADLINDACEEGEGVLGSQTVDPLMRLHGDILEAINKTSGGRP